MHSDPLLQQVLECCWMVQLCRTATAQTYHGYHPMDATVGEMDWAAELQRILIKEKVKMEDPNQRQIGGNHYRAKNSAYQHWDLVADYGLSYFTGNITKYAARWRYKEGVRDLEKAIHYTDKLIALHDVCAIAYHDHQSMPLENLHHFCVEQNLSLWESEVLELAATYSNRGHLLRLREVLGLLLAAGSTGQVQKW